MKKIILLLLLAISQSCVTNIKPNTVVNDNKAQLYNNIAQLIKKHNSKHIQECNCMKAFYRNLLTAPNNTSRYIFDDKVVNTVVNLQKKRINILAIGSGKLLNELTALASVLSKGINLDIYLLDHNYLFYDDKDFAQNAVKMKNNQKLIPKGWQNLHIWRQFNEKKDEELITFLKDMHLAIDEFKVIIKELDNIYHTQSNIHVLKPPQKKAIVLDKPLDIILAIDAYMDLTNLISNLYYDLFTADKLIKFITLNKHISALGYFDSNDLQNREQYSQKSVSIEIHDVIVNQKLINTKLIEKLNIEPSQDQIKEGVNFINDPDINTEYSPLKN